MGRGVARPTQVLRRTALGLVSLVAAAGCSKVDQDPPSLGAMYGFVLADLDGDGAPEVIGKPFPEQLVVVDGKTFARRVVSRDAGGRYAAVGKLVIVDGYNDKRSVMLVDPKSGAVAGRFSLSDKVEGYDVAGARVTVRAIDGASITIDANTRALAGQPVPKTPAPPPCARAEATCTEGEETTLASGRHKVTLVVKARGTREGTFVCKDASGRETGRALVDGEGRGLASWDLAGGRVFAILRNSGELVAYDATTCARAWSVKDLTRPEIGRDGLFHPESVSAARGRLWVTCAPARGNRGSRFAVLDPSTGAVVSWL